MAGGRHAAVRLQPLPAGLGRARGDVLPDGAVLAEWWRRLVGRILDIIVTTVITVIIAFPWLSKVLSVLSDYAQQVQAAGPDGPRRTRPRSASSSSPR